MTMMTMMAQHDTGNVHFKRVQSSSPDSRKTCIPTTNTMNKEVWFPETTDVLLGRGKRCYYHPGNLHLRSLVEDVKTQYEDSTRLEKKRITAALVRRVQKRHGRFLKPSSSEAATNDSRKSIAPGGWVVVSDEEARLKVSHTFRNLNKREE